jgi:hypothetical protein
MQVEPAMPGLIRPGTRTSVLVLDQQRSPTDPNKYLDEMETGLRDQARGVRRGLQFAETQRTEVAGHPALTATGTQTVGPATFDKVVVVIATEDAVVWLTGTLERGDPLTPDELLTVLRDARWTGQRAPSGLGIDITPAPGYQHVPSSGLVMLTLGGATGPDVPVFIAARSLDKRTVPTDERRQVAEDQFSQQLFHGNPSPQTVSEVMIAGLPGWELVGRSATDVTYAVILYTDDGFVTLTGRQPIGGHPDDQLPAFRQMARSLSMS